MATHILVINHSPDILDLFQAVLEPEGYTITPQLFTDRSVEDVARAQPDVLICDYPAICEADAWAFVQLLKGTADPAGTCFRSRRVGLSSPHPGAGRIVPGRDRELRQGRHALCVGLVD